MGVRGLLLVKILNDDTDAGLLSSLLFLQVGYPPLCIHKKEAKNSCALLEAVMGRGGKGEGVGDFNDRTGDRLTVGMWLPILLLLCWGERRGFCLQ